ncbi:hypothetical protein SPRG_06267 [Saprolegnia parasitica CBS 223.65]|uniref:Polycystin cation channel PKD1/PKD2 domain-containing protein n=1 Tax=Saprolegnia parasitica (strain CBS 223.65) TaxID=695850 RepID=A0A067CCN3_SAPPC|nr:hypothetical protein SPRG_06267 [Saprolegnia parasitica CBS 223.65]KDO28218.1 hypothetical protein SPRG_06267 [Saprolegnia parasitica CBS 223.65]|eukprot:XP_012201043.1 hypothetical protein SPRG_06267 [Saprolegnia parasitica CBS 223.65]
MGAWILRCAVHALLVVGLTLHASQVDNHLQAYTRGLADELWTLVSAQPPSRAYDYELYTMDDTIAHVHSVLDNYFMLPVVALGRFRIAACDGADDAQDPLACPTLRVVESATGTDEVERFYDLQRGNESSWPVGLRYNTPHDVSRVFFDALVSMELSMRVEVHPPSREEDVDADFEFTNWNISFAYDLSAQGQLHGQMRVRRLLPTLTLRATPKDLIPRYVAFIVLAVLYQLLELGHLVATLPGAQSLETIGRHLYFTEPWCLVVLCMNVATVAVSIQAWQYAGHLAYFEQLSLTFATACGLAWVSSLRYLHANARFYILGLTLRRGLPRVLEFLIGVGPLFVGYVLFGTVMFGSQVPRFQGLTTTATTLFAIANGDEVRLTFDSLAATPFLGQIYLYSYIMLFTYVVLMVCIGIIEDAFFSSAFPSLWKQPATRSNDDDASPRLANDAWLHLRSLILDETDPSFRSSQTAILNRVQERLYVANAP